MQRNNIYTIIISIMALGLGVFNILSSTQKTIAFIDLKYVFENFEYKKELQIEFDKTIELRKNELQNLKTTIEKTASRSGFNRDSIEFFNQVYNSKAAEFRETNLALSREMDQKIYKQIRQYLTEFVKKEGLKMLVSQYEDDMNIIGDGTDKTKDVLSFINAKYHDKQ